MENVKSLRQEIINLIEEAKSSGDLENIKLKYLSKKGEFSKLMALMKDLPNDKKPLFGKEINEAREIILEKITHLEARFKNIKLNEQLASEEIDVTIPGTTHNLGTIHPLNQVIADLEDYFVALGYEVKDGPEVELDYYNFEMMNFPKGHPAREMQDTFYVDEETLLRTHTSPVQARVMLEAKGSPVKIICPGKTFRRDEDDPTHSHQFMQIEGLVVDKNISFANLKETLLSMVRHLFGSEREIRLRPSYFPFVEPGVEVDVVHYLEDGTKTYIEILGAGLVHPKVLENGGYDSTKYSGFAFGVGVERIAILKYGIEDIRNFYTNDLKFLRQFVGDLK